jgi:hypothetical protein
MNLAAILGWVGAVTGPVGALTGTVGLVLGVLAYRRTGKLKALDLRLELRRAERDTHQDVEGLQGLLNKAHASHCEVSNSTLKIGGTGDAVAWMNELHVDRGKVEELVGQLPDLGRDYTKLSHEALEAALAVDHALSGRAAQLRDKYEGLLQADDKERERLAKLPSHLSFRPRDR